MVGSPRYAIFDPAEEDETHRRIDPLAPRLGQGSRRDDQAQGCWERCYPILSYICFDEVCKGASVPILHRPCTLPCYVRVWQSTWPAHHVRGARVEEHVVGPPRCACVTMFLQHTHTHT